WLGIGGDSLSQLELSRLSVLASAANAKTICLELGAVMFWPMRLSSKSRWKPMPSSAWSLSGGSVHRGYRRRLPSLTLSGRSPLLKRKDAPPVVLHIHDGPF